VRARILIAGAALVAGGLGSAWRASTRAPAEGAPVASVAGAAPVYPEQTTVPATARSDPPSSAADRASAAAAQRAPVSVKPPPRSEPAPAAPPPGADDPGPGPWIDRYDGRSGRLSPSARPEGADPTTRVESPGGPPTLVVWVPTIRVQAGREVVLHAALIDESGAPVALESIVASLARRGGPASAELPLVPAPPGSTHHFELRLRAPDADPRSADPAPAAFDYTVQARGTWQGEPYVRTAAAGFLVHSAGGGVDPATAHAERRGDDLALLFEARVERPGTYWAWAELWGGPEGTEAVAFARERFEGLGSGVRPLALVFGGAIIRDAGVDGPFIVRNLRWQQVDAFPPQEQDPIAQLPPTQAFRARDFR